MGFSGNIPIPDNMYTKLNAVFCPSASGFPACRKPVFSIS